MGFMYLNGMPMMGLIPNNFSAANHTIVNTTYTYFSRYGPDPTFNHTSPASINGTWEIWNGTATTSTSYKYEFTFNASGFCTRNAFYVDSPTGWNLTFEMTLLPPSAGGFSVSEGDTWSYTITVCNPILGLPVIVGDKIGINISVINSSTPAVFPNGWTTNTVNGYYAYYNSTEGIWHVMEDGNETLIAAYNSISSFDNYDDMIFGQYNYFSNGFVMGLEDLGIPMLELAPLDFSAANHTIVNMTYAFFTINGPQPTFNFTTPSGIAGTWKIWNGTATAPGNYKLEYTLDVSGKCVRNAMYISGTGGWKLVYEATTAGLKREISPEDLLLLAMMSGGGDQQMNDVIGIGITAAIFFIPLAIGLASKESK